MYQGGFFQIESEQETATPLLPWLAMDTFTETSSEARPSEQFYHKIAERVALPTAIQKGVFCRRLPSEESAYPFKFKSNIIINFSGINLLYQSFKNKLNIIINHKGRIEQQEFLVQQDYSVEGPSDEAWTEASWVSDAPNECTLPEIDDISDIRTELRGLLDSFKHGLPIERPNELLSAAEQIATRYTAKKEEDIEKWADKLSKDLSKLSD